MKKDNKYLKIRLDYNTIDIVKGYDWVEIQVKRWWGVEDYL